MSAWDYALTFGDDYKLCFTADAVKHEMVMEIFKEINIPVCCIGKITGESGLNCKGPEGTFFEPSGSSYQHF